MPPLTSSRVLPDGSLAPCDLAEAIACVARAFRAHEVAVFYGAGLSFTYPALLPMAVSAKGVPGLCEILQRALLTRIDAQLPPDLVERVTGLSLEVLLDYSSRYLGPGLLEFYNILRNETYVEPPRPNLRHAWLALLAQHSLCTNFLTVNFDLLDLTAFQALGVPVQVPEQETGDGERLAYELAAGSPRDGNVRIFKLHGMIDPHDTTNRNLLATVERVGSGLPPHKKLLLREMVGSHDLLFFGYSDRDIDVFPQIARVSSPHRFFWFELEERRIAAPVLQELGNRRGLVFAGDPDALLLELSSALGLPFGQLLDGVGCGSLDELRRQHAAVAADRVADLARFGETYVDRFFPDETPARLLLGNLVVEARWGFPGFLRGLVSSLPVTPLEPQLEYARQRLLAEYFLTNGGLTDAFRCRREALALTRRPQLSGSLRIDVVAAAIEQEAWCFLEAARIVRGGRAASKPWYLFQTLRYWRRVRRHLVKLRPGLRPFDANTFHAMLQFGWGNVAQTAADGLQRWRIRCVKPPARRILGILSNELYAVAEPLYRRGLDPNDMSDHWRFQLMQRVAETLIHRSGRPGLKGEALRQEARGLLDEAGTFFDWGRPQRRVYMDVHRGLERLYSGEPHQALAVLENAHREYRESEYLAGMMKTTFYASLAYDALGDRSAALRKLQELEELIRSQH